MLVILLTCSCQYLLLCLPHLTTSSASHISLIRTFLTLSLSVFPAIHRNTLISVVQRRDLVLVESALDSILYVIMGRTQVLYIFILLSVFICLFLHMVSFRHPDMAAAFLTCPVTSLYRSLWLLISAPRYLKLLTLSLIHI